MPNPSGSSAARGDACPGSHAFPRVDETGEPAARGLGIHAFLARAAPSPAERSFALADAPTSVRGTCEGIDLPTLLDDLEQIRCEVAYAYDVETGKARLVGVNIGRRYGTLGANEVACTLDLEARRRSTGRWLVRDWKTGQDVGEVEDNWQIRIQALCERAIRGEAPDGELVYIGEDGSHRVETYAFDDLDLDDAAERLRDIVRRVHAAEARVTAGREPDVSPGEHCKYCPAAIYCPAKRALVRDMRTLLGELPDEEAVGHQVALLPVERLGEVWLKAKDFAPRLKAIESAIKERAASEPIPLPGGKVLVSETRQGQRRLKEKEAAALLRELGVPEERIAALYTTSDPYLYPQTKKAG